MSRIRTIKPEAFKDAALWDAEQETGFPLFRAYVALWCQCDKQGRFVWKPRELKIECLPYWEGDFSRVLDALATRGWLVKYTSGAGVYGWIPNFRKHQFINGKEPESVLPAPDGSLALLVSSERVTHARLTRDERVPDAPIPSPSLPVPNPVPDPSDARALPEGETDRELPCPLDLLSRPGFVTMLRGLAQKLPAELVSLEHESREMHSYYTLGAGSDQKRLNWTRFLSERLRKRYHSGDLKPPGAVSQAARNGHRAAGREQPEPPARREHSERSVKELLKQIG